MNDLSGIIKSVLPAVLQISHDAGTAILEVYGTEFSVDQKEDKSPLTEADRRSHEVISKGLKGLPGMNIPILSEEGRNMPYEERRDWETFWLVDPLDGTKEFIKRNGEFTVNIALIHKGRPLAGVVYIPVSGITYFAAEGLGSYMLTEDKKVSGRSLQEILDMAAKLSLGSSNPSGITVIGSRSHMSGETEEFINKLRSKYSSVDFVSAGSSLKFCLIAEGKADIYPRFAPTMEWDTGAGQAVVEQAGGGVLRWPEMTPLEYNKESLVNPWFVAGRAE